MTDRPGQPNNDPSGMGSRDDAYWWMGEDASRASRPSDMRMRLDRLRNDVNAAPDLSAKILGQAGAKDIFVPKGRRKALRAMRWGGGVAAAMALGVTLWVVHRTPTGEVLLADQPTPVTDLVDDITADAQRFAINVRELPERVVSSNRQAQSNQVSLNAERARTSGAGSATLVAGFSPDTPVSFASRTYVIVRPEARIVAADAVAPLGASQLANALDSIARVLAEQPVAVGVPFEAQPARAAYEVQQAGFFASDPDRP